jgi:hypothetical protein
MTQLSNKIILDQQILIALRNDAKTVASEESSPNYFLEQMDGLLNQHLRGLDFQVKKMVKSQIIESHFRANQTIKLTYYDVAQILLNMKMPTKQVIQNFQNWILMSTEFALPYEEVIRVCLEEDFENAEKWQIVLEETLGEENDEVANFEISDAFSSHEKTLYEIQPLDDVALALGGKVSKSYRIRYGVILLYIVAISILSVTGLWAKKAATPVNISFKDACSLIYTADPTPREIEIIVKSVSSHHSEGYPNYLCFEPVNKERLKGYLKRKNSLLADEPYFSTILESSAIENVHPALLFAITGQEQGFVKRGSVNAALIVNNPFNVYHSWVEYNTDLSDSSRVAAQTVRAALEDRPKGENAFKWLNQTYAEDNKWWRGTEDIFMSIEEYIGPYHLQGLKSE